MPHVLFQASVSPEALFVLKTFADRGVYTQRDGRFPGLSASFLNRERKDPDADKIQMRQGPMPARTKNTGCSRLRHTDTTIKNRFKEKEKRK